MADNVTTDELEQALQDLANEMGLSVKEYVESLGYATADELLASKTDLQAQITAITELDADNGAESLAEKIAAINAVVSDEDGVVQNILAKILENKQSILDESARATDVEADLQSQITSNLNKTNSNETALSNLADTVSANKSAQDTVNADIESRVAGAESTLTTLTGDETVDGSIAKVIADETTRTNAAIATAKAGATDDAKAYTDEQIEAITGDTASTVEGLDSRLGEVENTLADTTDEDDNLVKGIVTRVGDVETALTNEVARAVQAEADMLAQAKAYTDANTLKASSMDICGVHNKFRAALGLADKDCSGSGDGDGAVV